MERYQELCWEIESGLYGFPDSFEQLVGEHALIMTRMAKARKNEHSIGVMQMWSKLDDLCKRWTTVITGGIYGDEFAESALKMVHGYSALLGDWINNPKKVTRKRVDELCADEARFYHLLSSEKRSRARNMSPSQREILEKRWFEYTESVLRLTSPNLDPYKDIDCMYKARHLGCTLDEIRQ